MAPLLAFIAAPLFALGTVLQQRAAMREPDGGTVGANLLLRLVRRPVWLAGIASDSLGYLAQAAALGLGKMVVVQPILALSVVFSLPLGARLSDQRVSRRQLLMAAVVTAGLGAFLAFSDPAGGRNDAPFGDWLIVAAVATAVCVPLVVGAIGRGPTVRAALLGIATGVTWGISAGLTKATVDQLDDGLLHLVTDWHLYGLIAAGGLGLALSQASLQAGALAPAIATTSILDPLTSMALGLTIFQERLEGSTIAVIAAFLGLALALAGLYLLAATQASDVAEAEAEVEAASASLGRA